MPTATKETVLIQALEAAVTGDESKLDETFTEDVVGWSPNLAVTSRAELAEEFGDRHDVLSNIVISFDAVYIVGDNAIAEWRIGADHTGTAGRRRRAHDRRRPGGASSSPGRPSPSSGATRSARSATTSTTRRCWSSCSSTSEAPPAPSRLDGSHRRGRSGPGRRRVARARVAEETARSTGHAGDVESQLAIFVRDGTTARSSPGSTAGPGAGAASCSTSGSTRRDAAAGSAPGCSTRPRPRPSAAAAGRSCCSPTPRTPGRPATAGPGGATSWSAGSTTTRSATPHSGSASRSARCSRHLSAT